MTRAGLSRALIACLGLGAADVAALNLAVLPGLRSSKAQDTAPAPATAIAPAAAPAPAPAPVAAAKTMEPPPVPTPAPEPAPAAREVVAAAAAVAAPERVAVVTPPREGRDAVAIVEFEKDSHRVGLRATWTLHKVSARLQKAPEILVVGHADSSGSREVNERISVERAAAVARRLGELGVPQARLRVEGRADREPRGAGNDRRVELFIGGTP